MDPLYHAITGAVLAEMVTGNHIVAGIVATNIPDIVGVPLDYGMKIRYARKDSMRHFFEDIRAFDISDKAIHPVSIQFYKFAHSLLMWVGVSVVTFAAFPDIWLLVTLGHALHLATDIPTHSGDYATRLFFPFSDWHVSWGNNWTGNKRVFLKMWGMLIVVVFLLLTITVRRV